ncbi:hypothetical protein [[Flexibacter] sp. ATCC 35208]|uniref:hypothetical protein n=1 Tax=[Flexibacter] sp. ATCC 35208 TaxID=1936242 RepID=UPI0009CEA2F6|nr:hypothetical protein [[Flexibacter] sp. ATCC 35208]OMP74859.1 hypothetical protein BW716_33035 [[Flexibacter] sp. ATCC 35208]
MYGIRSLVALSKLQAANFASQAAHGAAIVSSTVAKASDSNGGTVVKNGIQNSIVDKIKNFFSFTK